MKLTAPALVLTAAIVASGCASHRQKTAAPAPAASSVIITPDASLSGKVFSYNEIGRFVVLDFPVGRMPNEGQTLFLYRNGLKAGEVKISNWQRDNFIVADLVAGDAQPGDEVRDQ